MAKYRGARMRKRRQDGWGGLNCVYCSISPSLPPSFPLRGQPEIVFALVGCNEAVEG